MHRDTGLALDILGVTTQRADRVPELIGDRVDVQAGFDRSFA